MLSTSQSNGYPRALEGEFYRAVIYKLAYVLSSLDVLKNLKVGGGLVGALRAHIFYFNVGMRQSFKNERSLILKCLFGEDYCCILLLTHSIQIMREQWCSESKIVQSWTSRETHTYA